MKKRWFLLASVFVLLLALAMILPASAEEPTVTINGVSLGLEDRVCLLYRVAVAGDLPENYNVTMQFGANAPNNNWQYTTAAPYRAENETTYFFSYNGQKPMEMVDSVYCRAVLDLGTKTVYSDFVRYSVLDYAHNERNSTFVLTEGGATLGEVIEKILRYGAVSQTYFGYKTNRLATGDYYLVRAEGGTFPDGVKTAIAFPGDTVTLTADEPDDSEFTHWEDETGTVLSQNPTETFHPAADAVYRAAFKKVPYSKGLAFASNGNGTCYVSGLGTCTDTDILIPKKSPAGDRVTSIEGYVAGYTGFYNCSTITSVVIQNSVTRIGDCAFFGCSSLTNIEIPDSVISIGGRAFTACTALTSIEIPNSVTSIEANAFYNCTSLESIKIPNGVTTIEGSTFYNCTALTSVTIPDSVTSIGGQAFWGCASLTDIEIPNGVTSIDRQAFYKCSSLTSIEIPDSVTSIGNSAFSSCSKLQYGTYGNAKYLGNAENPYFALIEANYSITSCIIHPDTKVIANTVFSSCPNLASLTVAEGDSVYRAAGNCIIETASGTLIAGCKNSVILTDAGVTRIGDFSFYKCKGLTGITIPDSVTSIGKRAFYDCTSLTNITISDRVTSMEEYAYYGCSSLTSITYAGTQAQWNAISKGDYWDYHTGTYTVHCTDGDIAKQ